VSDLSDLLSGNPDVMRSLLAALSDPGRFTPRADERTEPMLSWQRRAVIEHAAPYILAAERERLAAVIPPQRFRDLAAWFDTDDEFKVAMFPETWPRRGHDVQDDLRRFADALSGGEAAPVAPSSSGEAIAYAALERAIERMCIAEGEVLTLRTELASAQNAIGQVIRKAQSVRLEKGGEEAVGVDWLLEELGPWTGETRSGEGEGHG